MSMNNLRSTPTGGNGGNGGNNDRPRLTDAEKKQNHIISEQKRRQAIRQGFDRLASLVPGMEGQGRSEALVLGNGVNSIKYHTALKAKLKKRVLREKPEMTESQFEAFYEQFLVGAFVTSNDADPAAAAGTSAAAGPVSSRTNSPRSVSSDGDGKAKGKGKVKQERR